ncbi:hypothetical protein K227x_56980 [Rubripirellula lacrimiformis]|uniref:Uncharacterized protein n=1 Tax=Rubripirellula lacrimiformis TaxID=1930273 RepID=A0A517NJG3_9BACT|nr:hypothetical protein K227x_56980 [Rubripirellula lacrimiformis]
MIGVSRAMPSLSTLNHVRVSCSGTYSGGTVAEDSYSPSSPQAIFGFIGARVSTKTLCPELLINENWLVLPEHPVKEIWKKMPAASVQMDFVFIRRCRNLWIAYFIGGIGLGIDSRPESVN